MRRLLAGLVLTAAACSGTGESALVIGVASSMTEAAQELGEAYGKGQIKLSVAGSQVLVAQVREGAPLDIVLTADATTAETLAGLGAITGEPVAFARNRLAIAVAEGNPRAISRLSDLTDPRLTVVLAAPEVPAGRYTDELLQAAGVPVDAASLEPSVRSVLAKVQLGEADAGIVYRTDLNRPGVTGIAIPEAVNPVVEYYAVALKSASNPTAATAFVGFLQSSTARSILADFGFLP